MGGRVPVTFLGGVRNELVCFAMTGSVGHADVNLSN